MTKDKYDIDIPKKEFEYLKRSNNINGLVFLGCGGSLKEWHKGIIADILETENLATFDDFESPYYVKTTGGRIDLVLEFKNMNLDTKLALWRLKFGDCSWISDYITNYIDHHC